MTTFICTVCQNRITEHGSTVDCKYYGNNYCMIEDTTKLYDKQCLCSYFIHVKYRNVNVCKHKQSYKYKYDALCAAAKLCMRTPQIMRPYKCNECHRWHLTTSVEQHYDPVLAWKKAKNNNKIFD